MRSWTSTSRPSHNPRCSARLVAGSLIMLALAGGSPLAAASAWHAYPWLTVGMGQEDDLILLADPVRTAVPGGALLDISPGVSFARELGGRSRVTCSGRTTLERFLNSERRQLLAGTLEGNLLVRGDRPWYMRLTAGAGGFDDSERDAVQRFDGGLETAMGWTRGTGSLELVAAGQWRRYPNLTSPDDLGVYDTYSEESLSLGARATLRPAARLQASLQAIHLGNDARDPLFDSDGWMLQAASWWRLSPRTGVSMLALQQRRDFTSRTPGANSDRYWQVGAQVDMALSSEITLAARYAFARATAPEGDSADSHRVTLALTWRPGRTEGALTPLVLPPEPPAGPPPAREGEPHLFRLRAPQAQHVALVGDFDDWDPLAHVMEPAGDGWWEVRLALPAGTFQYAYWVDGRLVTPPDADTTVDDGFGGRNGLVQVWPADL